MQSAEEFVKDCGYPSICLIAMVAARDAEWQARVDTLMEDNVRSEEQVKKQFATAVSFKARAEKAEAQVEKLDAEVRRLRAMLEPTPDARELAEEIQNIKWLIDEGPAHEKLTEAQVRLSAVKEKIVARNNILTNDSYNLTTVLYNHMTRGPWKHIPPEFYEIEERKAEVAQLIAAHDARLLDEAAERAMNYLITNTRGNDLEYDGLVAAVRGKE